MKKTNASGWGQGVSQVTRHLHLYIIIQTLVKKFTNKKFKKPIDK